MRLILTIQDGLKYEQARLIEERVMLQKFKNTSYVFILCLFGLTILTVSPVSASDFGDRLTKCDNKKVGCYKKLVSEILEKLKKECGNQYNNLTTKIKNKTNLTFSKAYDYCERKPSNKGRDKIECFMELAKHAIKQFAYYEETNYCK